MFSKTDSCFGHDAQHLDILTIIFPIKTFQKQLKVLQDSSKTIFFLYSLKALPDKMRRKYRKLKRLSILAKLSTSNNMEKRDCNILSFGYVEVSG